MTISGLHWESLYPMETFSALLAICVGNSPGTGEFPAQRPATQSFDVFFDLRLNKRLSKQSRGWWFETLSCPLWRHCNAMGLLQYKASLQNANRSNKYFVHNLPNSCLVILPYVVQNCQTIAQLR